MYNFYMTDSNECYPATETKLSKKPLVMRR